MTESPISAEILVLFLRLLALVRTLSVISNGGTSAEKAQIRAEALEIERRVSALLTALPEPDRG